MNYLQRFIYWLFFPRIYWVCLYGANSDFRGSWNNGDWKFFIDGQYYTYPEAREVAAALQDENPDYAVKVKLAFPFE